MGSICSIRGMIFGVGEQHVLISQAQAIYVPVDLRLKPTLATRYAGPRTSGC